jgi:signal transduction histidine kinase
MATHQIADVLTDADYGLRTLQSLAGFRTMLATPMILQDGVVGVLSMWRTEVAPFDVRERELVEEFAAEGAIALQHTRLFRELDAKTKELEIASRHKSEFLASMSHELRTPLNAVIGFSEVLLDRLFGDINERQEGYLHDIRNSGKHLLQLLNEILDLSKVEAGQMVFEPTTFDVRTSVDYALSVVRERATAHALTVTAEIDDDIDTVETDELKFKQVIVNLVTNAVKFTPDGGRVWVRAHRDGTDLTLTVTDTGIGVPPEDQERIFESFQQGRRGTSKEEGTGLGLTLSRRFVELMGGWMWLDSVPGEGSTFGCVIPGLPARGEAGVALAGDALPAVVVVDDDRASLELLSAYLEGAPLRVVRARDGIEALEAIREVLPVAVVLDIQLPRLDGWEVLADLKSDAATAGIPVIVASVLDERAQALALGAAGYLHKPMGRDDLMEALRRVGAV